MDWTSGGTLRERVERGGVLFGEYEGREAGRIKRSAQIELQGRQPPQCNCVWFRCDQEVSELKQVRGCKHQR